MDGAGTWKAGLFPEHPRFTKLPRSLSSRLAARPKSTLRNVTNVQKAQFARQYFFETEKARVQEPQVVAGVLRLKSGKNQ